MKTQKIPIKGMHCRSCEILIEDELKKVPGIKKSAVNYEAGVANIFFKQELNEKAVKEAIERAGYRLGEDGKTQIFSLNKKDYVDLGIAFFIATAVFLIVKTLGLFKLGNSISGSYSSLTVVFLVGLTAGISTCMALVGGLVLGAAARFSQKYPQASTMEKFKPHLFFNLGRITSYFVLGGLIGLLGSLFQLSSSVLGILTVSAALVMLLLGGQLIDIFPILKKINFTLPKNLHQLFGIKERSAAEYSHKNSAITGALTFFLPCGFTQAMQLYAMSTGSFTAGALTMGVFSLGTAPGLLGVGGLTASVKGGGRKLFFKTAGVVIILLALFNLSNGLNLLGFRPNVLGALTTNSSAENNIQDPNVSLVNGVQEVRMTQVSSGYTPNRFTIKKGIPVRWIITSKDDRSCASSLISQQLGIRQRLLLGENVIEFKPLETGTIRFSCAMGMYTGSFNVVDEKGQADTKINVANNNQNDLLAGGGSCGQKAGQMTGGCGCGARPNVSNRLNQNSNEPSTAITVNQGKTQLIKASYTLSGDIIPNQFAVEVNRPVLFEIEVKEDGYGCMGSITLPGLSSKVEVFTKGKTINFNFTPIKVGRYDITCGMGVPRGQIIVN